MRLSRLRACGIVCAALLLQSCNHQIDEMHIRLSPDQSGTFSAQGSVSVDDADLADLDNSFEYGQAKKIEGRLRDCGLSAKTYTRGQSLRVDARSDFDNPEDLNSLMQCVPTTWKDSSINVRRTEGWMSDSFVTTLSVRQNVLNRIAGRPPTFSLLDFKDFPTRLSLFVPGTVSRVENQSSVLGGTVNISQPERDLALLELKLDPLSKVRAQYQEAETQAAKTGKTGAGAREDIIKVVVYSSKWKFSIDNFLTLAGIIFGSGLLFELSRRIFRVRLEPRAP